MPRLKVGTIYPTDEEDAQIRAGIAADPDTYEVVSDEDWARMKPMGRGRPKADVTKDRITVRLSSEVTAYFKATGKGWQTRMDAVLREYVAQHKAA
ncbi:MAG: hypothetical protein BWK73_26770 [Thiothrix lacustris]|uniref:BrnA antitoxin of type II toxin-antitoxin system n=1 Tax=Thiothrix lacustris TaxID=525917 RepID=A0A1Y1QKJ2_9GAMM|nr:MAG: hypothetical protein BWK73_26770 [Thiothrix lacustris]